MRKIGGDENIIFVYDAAGRLAAEYNAGEPVVTEEIPRVSYLTNDHLGSPRIVTDANGGVVSRKDFAAFGDETITSHRTPALGYPVTGPDIRQDYTGYQKDTESGLEFAQARYYNSQHGRFTSVDPLTASTTIKDPQSFNRYSYVLNSPYKFTDPLGLFPGGCGADRNNCDGGGGFGSANINEAMGAHDARLARDAQNRDTQRRALKAATIGEAWDIINESGNADDFSVQDYLGRNVANPGSGTVTVEAIVNSPIDDDISGNEDVGITIVVWDKVKGISTRVLGHVSYWIDNTSYSFDATGYHPQTIGEYLNESLKISGATFYMLDFGSKDLNNKFKELIKGEYTGVGNYYTGGNNCSSAFGRSINAMRKELRTWTMQNTPAGVASFITKKIPQYLTGQYRLEKR